MADLTVVYWRDIPAQVIAAKSRRDQVKQPLNVRFEQAIDRAAMKGKESSADDYLEQWRKVKLGACDDDLQAVVTQKIAEIEAEYDTSRIDALVVNGGNEAE